MSALHFYVYNIFKNVYYGKRFVTLIALPGEKSIIFLLRLSEYARILAI